MQTILEISFINENGDTHGTTKTEGSTTIILAMISMAEKRLAELKTNVFKQIADSEEKGESDG